ncbi:MAG: hypothetical protein ACO3I1_05950 [Burkholderiales bacterium]
MIQSRVLCFGVLVLMGLFQSSAYGREAVFLDIAETVQRNSYLYHECFGMAPKEVAETTFLKIWCTDDSLHKEIAKIEKQIRFIQMKQGSYVFGFHSLESCVEVPDPRTCIVNVAQALKARAVRTSESTKAVYADKGDPGRAQKLLDEVIGEYRHEFQNTRLDDETYQSENSLIFYPVSERAAYLSLKYEFPNGHQCRIDGVVEFKSDERWILHDTDEANVCFLSASFEPERIVFSDPDDTCRKHCSAKASLDGVEMLKINRREIESSDRLLTSKTYQSKVRTYLHRSK